MELSSRTATRSPGVETKPEQCIGQPAGALVEFAVACAARTSQMAATWCRIEPGGPLK